MNGFRNWMARYMVGRYGNDELNRYLLIVSAIMIVIGILPDVFEKHPQTAAGKHEIP